MTRTAKQGVRYSPDGTGYTYSWAVFPATTTDEAAFAALGYPSEHNGGPGQPFAFPATFRRSVSRLLVVQISGMDI
jgi:hypothetical protein